MSERDAARSSDAEFETVLRNWIEQALSPIGKFGDGTDSAKWVAAQFCSWWRQSLGVSLDDADASASHLSKELNQLGGWQSHGEAMEAICHLQDALADIRRCVGVPVEGCE